eukprot:1657488-Prymnesium_polylepis.1
MALPRGTRGCESRPRDCTGTDGSEHLHRVSRIDLAPRDGPRWCARLTWGAKIPTRDLPARPGVAAVV